ncbi:hypothetical protein QCE80_13570, partial [Staphylococcus aureus]|nr:hypothetical protein [Staphylococcus aureus]
MVLIKRVKKPHNITQRLSYPFQLASFSFEHAWEWRCNLGSKVVMKNSKISLAWQILLALV